MISFISCKISRITYRSKNMLRAATTFSLFVKAYGTTQATSPFYKRYSNFSPYITRVGALEIR